MSQKNCFNLFLITLFLSFSINVVAQRVDTVSVYSDKMGVNIKNIFILPDNYNPKESKKYPVVYLLHGHGGNYGTWLHGVKKNLVELATRYQMIIVCPDGKNSWYWDSPIDPKSSYDTYISKELVSFVDLHYKTIDSGKGRAISGLSMGGHGALWLTIQHPNVFGAAGSMSGGVDFRPFPKSWDIPRSLGDYTQNKERWNSYTVIENIQKLKDKDVPLIIDCGQDDFFLNVNEALHRKLLALKMPHVYMTSPGVHDSKYWGKSIEHHLKFFSEFLNKDNRD